MRWLHSLTGAALLLTAISTAPPAGAQSVLVEEGEPPQLFLLYTGDVIGHLDPCG